MLCVANGKQRQEKDALGSCTGAGGKGKKNIQKKREGSCGVLCVVGLIHVARFTVAAFPFEGGKSNAHGLGSRSDTLKSAQGCS